MIFKQIPLYRYLLICESLGLEKNVLDCSAGGVQPALSLFKNYGYKTHGIESSLEELNLANEFAKENDQNLDIQLGNIKELTFESNSFSYVYSYNSISIMKKDDIKKSINEMMRVLRKNGLMFVNFLTTEDFTCGSGKLIGDLEYEQEENGNLLVHSYFKDNEADDYFQTNQILFKESRLVERIINGHWVKQAYVDYIVRKR